MADSKNTPPAKSTSSAKTTEEKKDEKPTQTLEDALKSQANVEKQKAEADAEGKADANTSETPGKAASDQTLDKHHAGLSEENKAKHEPVLPENDIVKFGDVEYPAHKIAEQARPTILDGSKDVHDTDVLAATTQQELSNEQEAVLKASRGNTDPFASPAFPTEDVSLVKATEISRDQEDERLRAENDAKNNSTDNKK